MNTVQRRMSRCGESAFTRVILVTGALLMRSQRSNQVYLVRMADSPIPV
jgi:hypothetical protein